MCGGGRGDTETLQIQVGEGGPQLWPAEEGAGQVNESGEA